VVAAVVGVGAADMKMKRYYYGVHLNTILAAERLIEFGYKQKVIAEELGLSRQRLWEVMRAMQDDRYRIWSKR
jgi:hypothetical protein